MPNTKRVPKEENMKDKIAASRKEVGKRITDFYSALGISRGDFYRAIGMKYNTLQSYEQGRTEPGSLFFKRLIEVYPLADVGFILTGKKTQIEGYTQNDLLPAIVNIPVVDTIPHQGFSESISEEYIIDRMFTAKTEYPNAFILLVRGDGFSPDAKDGSLITLAPTDTISGGDLFVLLTRSNGPVLKRVYKNETGYRLAPPSSGESSIAVASDEIVKTFKVIEISTHFLRRTV